MKMNKRIFFVFLFSMYFVFFANTQGGQDSSTEPNEVTPQPVTPPSTENSSPSQSPAVTPASESYTVTFSTGNGTGKAPQSLRIKSGDAVVLPGPEGMTAPEAMEFDGWLANNGTKVSSPYRVTRNVTLTAQWKVSPIFILQTEINRMTNDIEHVKYDMNNMADSIESINDNIENMKYTNRKNAIWIIVSYIFWLVFVYVLSVSSFLRRTKITESMKAQKIFTKPDKKNKNFASKILFQLFSDAQNKLRINPAFYITAYKELCNRFVLNVFISMHIPLIISLYFVIGESYLNLLNLLSILFILHTICFIFILFLKRLSIKMLYTFSDCFYRYWYNKIANPDTAFINSLRTAIQNVLSFDENNKLLTAVKEFSQADKTRCDMLLACTSNLVEKLDKFTELNENNKLLTSASISESFEESAKTINELCAALMNTCRTIDNTLPKFAELSDKTKIDYNAMNKVLSGLVELKQLFASYKSEALVSELEHFKRVTAAREGNINSAFVSIEQSMLVNTNSLRKSYDKFFETCEKFTRNVSKEANEKLEINKLPNKITTRKAYKVKSRKSAQQEIVSQKQISRPDLQWTEIVSEYNEWALNPVSHLPAAFTYLQESIRIHEESDFKKHTSNESMWITNKYGSRKYLFPNPNLFDQMTDLKGIYEMDLSRLKAKGQNRIKIIKACEISDKGFIKYSGKLELL